MTVEELIELLNQDWIDKGLDVVVTASEPGATNISVEIYEDAVEIWGR